MSEAQMSESVFQKASLSHEAYLEERVKQLEWELEKVLQDKPIMRESFRIEELQGHFDKNEIEWRVQSSGKTQSGNVWARIVPYLTARGVMDRLDKVVGSENWQDRYEVSDKGAICYLSVRMNGDWIVKSDGANATDIEGFKGSISDALKRAAVKFGIGRYLYNMSDVYAETSKEKKSGWNYAKTKEGEIFFWKVPETVKF